MYFLSAGRVNEHRSCSSNYCTTWQFKRRACVKVYCTPFSHVYDGQVLGLTLCFWLALTWESWSADNRAVVHLRLSIDAASWFVQFLLFILLLCSAQSIIEKRKPVLFAVFHSSMSCIAIVCQAVFIAVLLICI